MPDAELKKLLESQIALLEQQREITAREEVLLKHQHETACRNTGYVLGRLQTARELLAKLNTFNAPKDPSSA